MAYFLRINPAAFGSGQPFEGIHPSKAFISLGVIYSGQHRNAPSNTRYNRGSKSLIVTRTGITVEDFMMDEATEEFKVALADYVNKNLIQLSRNNVPITNPDRIVHIGYDDVSTGVAVPLLGEGNEVNVGTAGITKTIAFNRTAEIDRIYVIMTAGTAANFTVNVYNSITKNLINRIYTKTVAVTALPQANDSLGVIIPPYFNKDGNDDLFLEIIPDAGTNNAFTWEVSGKELKTA